MTSFVTYIVKALRRMFVSYAQWLPHTVGKRVLASWTALILRRVSPQNSLSAAQSCNDDVLIEVFSHLDHVTLSTAARVCRSWQPAATNRLYHDIRIDTRKPSTRTLVDTLTAQPALRGLVRCVTLNHPPLRKLDLSLINWLALLPPHSLQSVVLEQAIFTLPETGPLIDFPAIRTVPCMLACGMLSVEGLTKILNMPHLETLAIHIDYNVKTLDIEVSLPKLRRLAIGSFQYTPVIEQLLKNCDTPLEQFSLVADELEEEDLISLKKGLRNHAPLLKQLSFLGHPFFESAFMDDYVLSFPSLETLLCPSLAYTPLLISALPRNLSSLILRAPAGRSFASDDYAAALQQHRHKLGALSEFIVLDTYHYRQQCRSLAEMCARENISFRTMDNDIFNPIYSRTFL